MLRLSPIHIKSHWHWRLVVLTNWPRRFLHLNLLVLPLWLLDRCVEVKLGLLGHYRLECRSLKRRLGLNRIELRLLLLLLNWLESLVRCCEGIVQSHCSWLSRGLLELKFRHWYLDLRCSLQKAHVVPLRRDGHLTDCRIHPLCAGSILFWSEGATIVWTQSKSRV